MKNSFNRILLPLLHSCRQSARIYLNLPLDKSLLEICQIALGRNRVVDLFLSPLTIQQLVADVFLTNHVRDLVAKGLNVYEASHWDHSPRQLAIVQIDFKQTQAYTIDAHTEEIAGIPFEPSFARLEQASCAFQSEHSGIKIQIKSDETTLFKGKSTVINWAVEHAESVTIEGIGTVEKTGKLPVQVLNDTILIIRASNRNQEKCRAVFLKTIASIEIAYDIQFLNPASKEYVSLKTEDLNDGVFGVSRGSKVKLVWDVGHTEEVIISPFHIRAARGEYIFEPKGTMEINIRASVQEKVKNQRIIVHEYPMPILTEKMVSIKGDFVSKMELNLKDHRQRAYHFLEEKKLMGSEHFAKDIKTMVKKQEENLMQRYNQLGFGDFYKEHSIERLNDTIIQRLKGYFEDKPEVVNMINTLQENRNEQRSA